MKDSHRYEIKFVVNDIRLAEFFGWLWSSTGMTEIYPERVINSLYFDDLNNQAVKDNLSGLGSREKFRLRWYGEKGQDKAQGLKLEKKVREGRLGYKESSSLAELGDEFLGMQITDIKSAIREKLMALGLGDSRLENELYPTLQVSYLRQYLQDMDGIRITVDSDINFYRVSEFSRPFQYKPLQWSKKIIEFKFSPEKKNQVADLIRPLHLVPQRCSKYLQGMAYNNTVMYR